MDFKTLIQKLDPTIYSRLKTAIEIGKWPDGRLLTQEQKMLSMQAVIAFEIEHNFPENQRVGYMDTTGSECHDDDQEQSQEQPLKWQ
jgi:uncharacterized protein YeaC (DUF1315 family)